MTSDKPAVSDLPAVELVGPTELSAPPEKRLHPAYLLIGAGRTLRAMIPIIVVSVVQFPRWLLGPLAALVVVGAVLSWWRTTYSVSDGVLRLSSGVFNRKIRTVHARRITAMETERGVIQRLFGVWGLKVQTPGDGDSATISLSCLTSAEVERLREALRVAGPASGAGNHTGSQGSLPSGDKMPALQEVPLATLGTKELLLTALTGTSLPLILAGLFTVWNRSREVLPDDWLEYIEHELFGRGRGTIVVIAVLILLAALVGIALTALRISNFTLWRTDDRLRITRGLLSQRSGTIAVDRVQAVRLIDGFTRRLIGYTSIEVEVAGLSGRDENQRTLFPLVRRTQAADLIGRALPELRWEPAPLQRISRRARRRYLTEPGLMGFALTLALVWAAVGWWDFTWVFPGWLLVLIVLPFALSLVIGWARARDAGWSLDENTLVVRTRNILSRHTLIARRDRVQITSVQTNPFQRRAKLATILFKLSSGRSADLRHLEVSTAEALLRQVGRPARLLPNLGRSEEPTALESSR